jgi:ADP-ribose pyrophosphatase YjhB (NUDIX family)
VHYIQKYILDDLRVVESERYAALNKHDVESGHFRYHLGQLISDGYVQQLERGLYALTTKGQTYVDSLSSDRIQPEKMPKVITYTLLTHDGKILLQPKPKHPYKDLLNMIGGKVHLGERTQDASIREVREKTGERIRDPQLRGIFEIRVDAGSELFTHAIAYVYQAGLDSMPAPLEAFDRSQLDGRSDLSPDLLPILDLIDSDKCVVDTITLEYDVSSTGAKPEILDDLDSQR